MFLLIEFFHWKNLSLLSSFKLDILFGNWVEFFVYFNCAFFNRCTIWNVFPGLEAVPSLLIASFAVWKRSGLMRSRLLLSCVLLGCKKKSLPILMSFGIFSTVSSNHFKVSDLPSWPLIHFELIFIFNAGSDGEDRSRQNLVLFFCLWTFSFPALVNELSVLYPTCILGISIKDQLAVDMWVCS